jgi:hypothetical protein
MRGVDAGASLGQCHALPATGENKRTCTAYCTVVPQMIGQEGQKKDRHFFVDQRLFCGMIRRVGTTYASAVREMNL